MATFRNRHGKWQARVQRKGQQPVSKSFQSKEDAQRWSRQIEAEINKGSYTNIALTERSLFKDVIERYVQEVTVNRWYVMHILKILKSTLHPNDNNHIWLLIGFF